MKKINLSQALKELKQAKSLAQRLAATSKLVNHTAYKAGQFFYGAVEPTHKETSLSSAPTNSESDLISSNSVSNIASEVEDKAQSIQKKEVDPFTKGLMQLNEELKVLRIAKELAQTDVESHAIHFKILRLERERHNYLAQRKTE